MAKKARNGKKGVEVSEQVANALGMNATEAAERVREIMAKHKILVRHFLNVILEDGKVIICATSKNVEVDLDRPFVAEFSKVRPCSASFTVGSNAAVEYVGHKLAALS